MLNVEYARRLEYIKADIVVTDVHVVMLASYIVVCMQLVYYINL